VFSASACPTKGWTSARLRLTFALHAKVRKRSAEQERYPVALSSVGACAALEGSPAKLGKPRAFGQFLLRKNSAVLSLLLALRSVQRTAPFTKPPVWYRPAEQEYALRFNAHNLLALRSKAGKFAKMSSLPCSWPRRGLGQALRSKVRGQPSFAGQALEQVGTKPRRLGCLRQPKGPVRPGPVGPCKGPNFCYAKVAGTA
jgi:hypothetical protein